MDRTSRGCSELIPLEGRDIGVEEISRVQRAIAEEFIHVSVKALVPERVTALTRRPRCGRIRRDSCFPNRELFDGIDAKVGTEDAAGRAVRVVVDADPIQTITVLIRAGS